MAMPLIAFLVLALAAAGYAEELNPLCAHGETYWCGTLYTAKSCGAFSHCKTTVWKNQQLSKDTAEICQFCESVIDDIKVYISQKKSENDIANFMKIACGIIPDQSLAGECTTAVAEMVPEIIELINTDVDSQVICSLVSVCSGADKTVLHPMHQDKQTTAISAVIKMATVTVDGTTEPAICVHCKMFFGDVKKWIADKSNEKVIEDLIDKSVCSELGSIELECKDYVHMFLPELLTILFDYFDANEICEALHFCNNSVPSHTKTFGRLNFSQNIPHVSSAVTCLICETILAELQALGRDKTLQIKLSNVLKTEICTRIRSSLKSQCEVAIDLYAPMLFQFLATELDPSTKCHAIGVCASEDRKSVQEQNKISVSSHTASAAESLPVAGPQCVICEWVMQELASLLANNATEQEILAGLDMVCDKLPRAVATECRYFVDNYGSEIIQMLIDEVDAEKICTALHLCSSSTVASTSIITVTSTPSPTPSRVAGAETCLMCETIVRYARAVVAKNATIMEIEAILDKICNFLPEKMFTQCRSIIETYSELLVQTLLVATPQEVCQLVHACEKKLAVSDPPLLVDRLHSVKVVKDLRVKRTVLGANPCTRGPSYWCKSRQNAENCGVVNWCTSRGHALP